MKLKIYLSNGFIAPPLSDVSLEKTTCYRSWRGSSTYSSHLNTDSESCIFPRRQEPSWLICNHGGQTETFPSEVDSFCFTICEVLSVCWNSNHHLDTCLWCGFIWYTYVIRWYTYYAIIHPNHVHKCLPLDDCRTDPQRWATRASPPHSRRPPAPTELAACQPPQNAIRCKIYWSFFYFEEKILFIHLYLIPLPTSTSGGYSTSVKWTSSSHFGR